MDIKRQKGFTLIELLMAMAMMAIMIAVVIVSLGGARTNRELDGEAGKILSLLRETQNYALTGKSVSGSDACDRFSARVSGNEFRIYHYDKSSGTCTFVNTPSRYPVGSGVALAAVHWNGTAAVNLSRLDFTIPNGQLLVNGVTFEMSGSQWVRFQLSKNSVTENVCVYPFGRMEQKPIGVDC